MTEVSSTSYTNPSDNRTEHRIKFASEFLTANGFDFVREENVRGFYVPLPKDGDDHRGAIVKGTAVWTRGKKHGWFDPQGEFWPAFSITTQGRIEIGCNQIDLPYGEYEAVVVDGVVVLQEVVTRPDPLTFEVAVALIGNGMNFIIPPGVRDACNIAEGEKVYFNREKIGDKLHLTRGSSKGSGRGTKMKTDAKITVSYMTAGWVPDQHFNYTSLATIYPGDNFEIILDLAKRTPVPA